MTYSRHSKLTIGIRVIVVCAACGTHGETFSEDGMLRVNTIPIQPPPTERASIGSLADGLHAYLSFDRHLVSLPPMGTSMTAVFNRNSAAYLPDLTRVAPDEPRFFPGRFGGSIFIESAWRHIRVGNQFPQTLANVTGGLADFIPVGSVRLSSTTGLLDASALRIDVGAAGGGVSTHPLETIPAKRQTISLYARGGAGTRLALVAKMEGVDKPLGTSVGMLSEEWTRFEVDYALPDKAETGPWPGQDRTPPIRLVATIDQRGWFLIDALMLESHLGYSGRCGASSWTAGNQTRDGERLHLPPPPNAEAGTLAFWASRLGDIQWRVLLCIDNGTGWSPDLRLDLRDNRRIQLVMGKDKKTVASANLPSAIQPGVWHHFVVTWDAVGGRVYVDGERVVVAVCEQPRLTSRVNIGGVGNNFSPALCADMLMDEFALWNRTLTDDEVTALFNRNMPLGSGIDTTLMIEDHERVGVFARDQRERLWPLSIVNNGAEPIREPIATFSIPGVFETRRELREIPSGQTLDVLLAWPPALIEPGAYEAVVTVSTDRQKREIRRSIEVVRAREPEANAHVIPWGEFSDDLRDLGFTSGAVSDHSPQAIETITRYGLYTVLRQNLTGRSEDGEDSFVDASGRIRAIDQRAPGPLADVDRQIQNFAGQMRLLPDVRHVIINCENQWSWHNDFRPATVAGVQTCFGLDLNRWRVEARRYAAAVHPGGRLSQRLNDDPPVPPSGILAPDDPFYAYHRWWHSGAVGNEIFLNDRIAVGTRKQSPHVQFVGEPVLRRPSIRAFQEMDLVQEWFYYGDPARAIWVQEATAAVARGSRANIGGMPQFLLKPGMAAPYGGLPTPDMFREAVWHCLARPMRGLTYWNHWTAIHRRDADNIKTQEEIDALLGAAPSWKEAAARVDVKGEHSSVFLFIPELRETIRRLHHDEVAPLGALIPRWENVPRRIAIYRSFAGELFNNVRWRDVTPLERMILEMQTPFDILYDEDFEDNDDLLNGYHLVAISQAPAIIQPAFVQLSAFALQGGLVVVDDLFKADIPQAVRVDSGSHAAGLARLAKREQELLSLYRDPIHPNYIEGMEQAARQIADESASCGTDVTNLFKPNKAGITTTTRAVFPNLLHAQGAHYLVAVNMLRRPGRHYGHFGKVREDGVAQTAQFTFDPAIGTVAYDLLNSTQIALRTGRDQSSLELDLPPSGGRVLVFLHEPIGRLTLDPVREDRLNRGQWLRLSARLSGESGLAVPGIIPVRVVIVGPDGQPLDMSRYDAFVNGAWSLDIPMTFNQPGGTYQLVLTELASGSRAQQSWIMGH